MMAFEIKKYMKKAVATNIAKYTIQYTIFSFLVFVNCSLHLYFIKIFIVCQTNLYFCSNFSSIEQRISASTNPTTRSDI